MLHSKDKTRYYAYKCLLNKLIEIMTKDSEIKKNLQVFYSVIQAIKFPKSI